uniref:Very-long-chain (3R)-3-hydroxyacyl-CoA dehydratase n=1 Tax=Terrapene triunguis TaxID=2587831 RepID=A0A674HXB5_9SAUR
WGKQLQTWIQNEESVILFLVVWTVTEITRYSFYTFNLLNHLPYFIKWARYNFFIILYPVGVAGELLTIYAALPYVKKTGIFSLRLPNKYNVSFDYYYFLIIVMASYIPSAKFSKNSICTEHVVLHSYRTLFQQH